MILILASVALVVLARRPSSKGNFELFIPNQVRLGLLFGAVSAFCYALAYIARKLAMVHLPDAALGAFIGALTGVVWYVFASPFNMRYRQSLTNVFTDAGKWQWLAATGMSFGQVLLFFALISAPVAVVAIIGSLEMFVGAYLAAFLFKSEPVPERDIVFATVIAATGTVLVAIG
jgi:drug/metabolite transporter (DMT)-like permease